MKYKEHCSLRSPSLQLNQDQKQLITRYFIDPLGLRSLRSGLARRGGGIDSITYLERTRIDQVRFLGSGGSNPIQVTCHRAKSITDAMSRVTMEFRICFPEENRF